MLEIKPEIIKTPELGPVRESVNLERPQASESPKQSETQTAIPVPSQSPQPDSRPALNRFSTPQQKEIEKVLEEDLSDIYFQLAPEAQVQFKLRGEITAKEIDNLFTNLKASAQKVADLIRTWLLVIPGVNKFFIEQETKIKTDKLMELYSQK